jgi:hypothetical protein
LAMNDLCDCGQIQAVSHIVDDCPLTRYPGGLQALHTADKDAFDWLINMAQHAHDR